jgi:hypothetical protein
MSETNQIRVFASTHFLLPGKNAPTPATLIVDAATGVINEIHPGVLARDRWPADVVADYVDASPRWVLPGLVECVKCARPAFGRPRPTRASIAARTSI